MARLTQLVSVAVLGFFVLVFTILLVIAASVSIVGPMVVPKSVGAGGSIFAVTFSVSSRTVIAVVAFVSVAATAVILIARVRRRGSRY